MRELEDITTLSDTHKRYIEVNGPSAIESLIYGSDKFVIGFTGRHHCRECGCVQSGQSGDYHHNADCSLLVKEFSNDIPEPVFTPVDDIDDEPVIQKHDLIICFVLLVVAIIAALAHWLFGG